MDADSHIVERDSNEWRSAIDMMEQKFGDTVKFLKDMTDFHMFKIAVFNIFLGSFLVVVPRGCEFAICQPFLF
mgnify:CR=1 FL=1